LNNATSEFFSGSERETYLRKLDEFKILLRVAIRIYEAMPEVEASQVSIQYCQALFDKLLFHVISLSKLLPCRIPAPDSLWDLSSISALSRCILEAYEALAYIAFMKLVMKRENSGFCSGQRMTTTAE
jgi:hypothetical protein